ncbi:hypothetical protein AAAX31_00100 [Collinsella sp. CLA-ER-H5]|uniref:hypothetical protein n=1 Tax=Collinsella sp. CLA-ER-H5 TaxID=3136222 RepID=UPI0032C1EDDB
MICIVGTRGSGKTTRLLELSAQSGVPIAVRNVIQATWLRRYMIRAEAVTIDADAVNFEFAIKANPTLVNCLRVWRNCKKGGKE